MAGIFRNEIYMVNFKESYKYCITGVHPCVIISSFKHLLKNDLIQVLPITSNCKKVCKSHCPIEGFGLDKDSKIQCEQVLTVNKIDLNQRIGKVSNIKMLEVNTVLKAHLQLDNKFKNLNCDELEEIFMENVKSVSERQLNKLSQYIRTTFQTGKVNECIVACNNLISKSKKNTHLWNAYYSKCISYIKLGGFESALENAKISIKYINEVDVSATDFSLSMFAMAKCYESIDKKKSVQIYKTLSRNYREIANDRMRLCCIYNIAVLNKNINSMERLIRIVENTNTKTWYFTVDKESFLTDMKKELDTVKSI